MLHSATKLQAHVRRGTMILMAFVLFVAASLAGCSGDEDARATAAAAASENFMTVYYQQGNAKAAVEFCTGEAKTKIPSQVSDIEKSGVGPDTASERPTVTVRLDDQKKIDGDNYQLVWDVRSSEGEILKVLTIMARSQDRWLVRKFSENQ